MRVHKMIEASKLVPRRKRRQRGLTLIESAMALGLFALASAFAVQQVANYLELQKSRTVAKQMVDVSEAAKGYVKANYAAILAETPVNAVTVIPVGRPNATAAVPDGPGSLDSLQGAGFLNSSFIDVNGYGQRYALLVRRVTQTRLEALVTTYGGRAINDATLTQIGSFVGNTGGFVLDNPPDPDDEDRIIGAYGGYRSDTDFWGNSPQAPTVGRFQSSLAFEDGNLLADYLYRNDIGIPEANRMNTAIDMNGNNIDNADTVNAQNVHAKIDVWAERNVIAGVDVNAGRDVNAVRDIHANRNIIAEQDVVAYRDLDVARNARIGNDLTVDRDATIDRNAQITGNLKVDGQTDLAVMDLQRTEVLIPDRFGTAQKMKLAELLPRQTAQYSYVVTPTQASVPKPDCGGDRSKARIFVYRQVESTKGYPQIRLNTTSQNGYLTSVAQDIANSFVNVADGIVATTASPGSTIWTVSWIGSLPADGATRQAIAQTYCYYG